MTGGTAQGVVKNVCENICQLVCTSFEHTPGNVFFSEMLC